MTTNISSRTQKQESLCKSLRRFIKMQEADLKMQKQFRERTQKMLVWLEDTTDVINMDDPNQSSDEKSIRDRMTQLKVRE